MEVSEYRNLFPNENVWCAGRGTHVLAEGMLHFDESACSFGGPFEGNYCYFDLQNYSQRPDWTLTTIARRKELFRFDHWRLPFRLRSMYSQPAQNEEHLRRRLAHMTGKELHEWEQNLTGFILDIPTEDKPVALRLAGNDDSTYTKFFAALPEAQEELQLLELDQPLNFLTHVRNNGFVFTN